MSADGSPDPGDRALRLFVALELDESVRVAISAWASAKLGTIGTLRPVHVDGLHVTLCFLGSTAGSEVEAISARCRDACAGSRPLRLSLDGLLALPRRRPRAVAVHVGDEGHGPLAELQRVLAGALAAGGWYRPESRPFLAHVTIARVRSGARLNARALPDRVIVDDQDLPVATRAAVGSLAAPAAFTANVVTLFESRTEPGGAVYRPRARIELAA